MSKCIGITMGDPVGVGPEIIIRTLEKMDDTELKVTHVFGSIDILEAAKSVVGSDFNLRTRHLSITDLPIPGGKLSWGQPDARAGDAAFRFIEAAVRSAKAQEIGCIVTAPINKAALNAAGHHYDGHTGMLAALTKTKSSFMLLASERLKVIHVSTHISLQGAIKSATTERVIATIRAGNSHLKRIGITAPRIAVAGLNPHCGEDGLFGHEDTQELAPAVVAAKAEGINVEGPIPADSLYYRAYSGEFDLVVAQFHDQGHIPIKLVAFDTAVNVSLGLPIDRTSVDHGTAFDIAGKGTANPANMGSAIDYARLLTSKGSLQ